MKTKTKFVIGFLFTILLVNCNNSNNNSKDDIIIGDVAIVSPEEITCFLDTPDPEKLLFGDPLPIVQGKLLSWATSTEDEIAYTPPGKWINIFGTVYYRYIEREEGDQIKVSEVAATCSNILTTEQLEKIIAILSYQRAGEVDAIKNRDLIARELIKFKDERDANETLILDLAKTNGEILSDLVVQRSTVFGEIFQQLTNAQKNTMCEARKIANHAASNNDILSDIDKTIATSDREILRLLLSKFFVWSTGVEETNRVIDAGRPAVFFGFANLRVEDRSGEEVSSGLRGETSKLVESTLNEIQHERFTTLILDQEIVLNSYYQNRGDLASLILGYQTGDLNVDLNKLHELCIDSEIAEAKLAIFQAKSMGEIINSLSIDQLKVFTDFKAGNGL